MVLMLILDNVWMPLIAATIGIIVKLCLISFFQIKDYFIIVIFQTTQKDRIILTQKLHLPEDKDNEVYVFKKELYSKTLLSYIYRTTGFRAMFKL